ncbi:MAG: hypothetical protein MUF65_13645 [Rubritepida sp.]|nr:hypothetical protein [Rubritepida sp.]
MFDEDVALAERVIFPVAPNQANGIEDARFEEAGAEARYVATYSGRAIRSELLETRDLRALWLSVLHGEAARNRAKALFSRSVGGC